MLSEAGSGPASYQLAARETRKASIAPEVILRWFADLDRVHGVLLAVSGGPDSMALLLLVARWRRLLAPGAPPIFVATVDHGLRPESRAEAEIVASIAADLDLPHAILTWGGPKPSTRVQERARETRYALLTTHAQAVGASHILTAHHADDQAETVLLRLGRGSGLTGLAGMRRITTLSPGVHLVRPLLDATKADLVALCHAESCVVVDDPSNRNPVFARARLRAWRQALADVGLDTPALTRLARRMGRADAAIEAETDRVEASLAAERRPFMYRLDLASAPRLEAEICVRLLGRAVAHVAGDRAIRLERLEMLAEAIRHALEGGQAHLGTLAGTRVVLGRDRALTITIAPPRRRGMRVTA